MEASKYYANYQSTKGAGSGVCRELAQLSNLRWGPASAVKSLLGHMMAIWLFARRL